MGDAPDWTVYLPILGILAVGMLGLVVAAWVANRRR